MRTDSADDFDARRQLFSRFQDERINLGIGIVTFNRPEALARSIAHVLKHTKRPYELVVGDDGSTEETCAAIEPYKAGLSHLRCTNRGVNFNKNRLLYYFTHVRKYDTVLILEDDSFPSLEGWEENWIIATQRWGHINNAGPWFASSFISGNGSLETPYLSPDVSAQCVGFSREAIEYVGFIDPALGNYGGGHAEHSYRMTRAGYGGEFARVEGVGRPNFYLIEGNIHVGYEETGYPAGDSEGLQKYLALRDGPIYRHAWRNDVEQHNLWRELATLVSPLQKDFPVKMAQNTAGMERPCLDELGVRNGTDKNSTPSHHDYLSFYEETFRQCRDDQFTLLEVGVYRGNSLMTWGEYFPNATVVGVDIDPEANVPITVSNVHIRIGDATRLEFLDKIVAEFGLPRITIDDGSHYWHHQIETFKYLWPRLLPGGYYIMEDLHTSFPLYSKDPAYRGLSKISTYDYLQKITRWIVGNRAMDTEIPDDGFIGSYWPTFRSINWYRGTCIMHKGPEISVRPPLKTS